MAIPVAGRANQLQCDIEALDNRLAELRAELSRIHENMGLQEARLQTVVDDQVTRLSRRLTELQQATVTSSRQSSELEGRLRSMLADQLQTFPKPTEIATKRDLRAAIDVREVGSLRDLQTPALGRVLTDGKREPEVQGALWRAADYQE